MGIQKRTIPTFGLGPPGILNHTLDLPFSFSKEKSLRVVQSISADRMPEARPLPQTCPVGARRSVAPRSPCSPENPSGRPAAILTGVCGRHAQIPQGPDTLLSQFSLLVNFCSLQVKDREAWPPAVHGVAKSQIRLSERTSHSVKFNFS